MGNLMKIFEIISFIGSMFMIVFGALGAACLKEKDGKIFFGIVHVLGIIMCVVISYHSL